MKISLTLCAAVALLLASVSAGAAGNVALKSLENLSASDSSRYGAAYDGRTQSARAPLVAQGATAPRTVTPSSPLAADIRASTGKIPAPEKMGMLPAHTIGGAIFATALIGGWATVTGYTWITYGLMAALPYIAIPLCFITLALMADDR